MATTPVCHCSRKAAIDSTETSEHGSVSVNLYVWSLRLKLHTIFTFHEILFCQPYKMQKSPLAVGCVISSSGPGCPQTGLFYFLLNLSIMIFQNWQMGELRSYQIQTPWVPQKERVAQKEKRLTPIHTAQDHSVSLLAHSLGHHHPWAPPPPPPQDLNRYTGFHLLAK